MHTYRLFAFLVALFPIVATCTSKSSAADPTPPDSTSMTDAELAKALVGSWRIIDAHRDGKTSELHMKCITLKHITPTQFTWLSHRPGERQVFRSMGGAWKIEDGMYVETPQYGTQENFAQNNFGRSVRIGAKVEGDIFTQTITSANGSKFVEIWQRVKPGEDWQKLPK